MKGSPFKLRSPLLNSGTLEANQNSNFNTELGKKDETIQDKGKELNSNVGSGSTTVYDESSKAATVADQVKQAGKFTGESAFDRDGRSVDKFDQRIADAESKGKLGRVQRLKNRKSGYMESQANKFERAGGTLSNQQKTDLNKATEESGGTRVGKALRAFSGRDAKIREVDPIIVKKQKKDNNQGGEGRMSL